MAARVEPDWVDSDPPQGDVLTEFLAELERSWVWLYRQSGDIARHSIGQYSALLSRERVDAGVSDPTWEAGLEAGGPGFAEYNDEGVRRTVYRREPQECIERLVRIRGWHGVRPDEAEIVEEFRLLFNLWEDRAARAFYSFDECGNPIKAAVVSNEGVRVLTSLLRRYQAAKQMWLALYIDSTRWSDELPAVEHHWRYVDDTTFLSYYCGAVPLDDRPFSCLSGKRVLPPPAIEACGIWPFERERHYEEFVIATTDTGEERRYTSDPDQLANSFGANPGRPHYLTPVYFRRDVLAKYYGDPDRYTVGDGYVSCAGLWRLRLDNDRASQVMVFLGDLGRDIPHAEAQYWRSFNITPPEDGPSETLRRRGFDAEFADPESVDLRFPGVYRDTNKAWQRAVSEPLFKPLHDDDRHVLSKLHVPVTNGAAEFDEQVLYLAKLLVDSLNTAAFTAGIAKDSKDEKGLAKLERWLAAHGIADPRSLLKPFADVQGLRSRGAAHRKGKEFDITVAIGNRTRKEGFEHLMRE